MKKLKTHPRFDELLKKMKDIYAKKDTDYAKVPLENFRQSERFGVPAYVGTFLRLSDKFSRASNLIKRKHKAKVEDEKFLDTMLDLANYALLTIILWEEEQKKNAKVEKHG
jgi:hypothetical protein